MLIYRNNHRPDMGACRTSVQDQDTLPLSLRSFFRTIPLSPFREKAYLAFATQQIKRNGIGIVSYTEAVNEIADLNIRLSHTATLKYCYFRRFRFLELYLSIIKVFRLCLGVL